jgi:hypothetical protein
MSGFTALTIGSCIGAVIVVYFFVEDHLRLSLRRHRR